VLGPQFKVKPVPDFFAEARALLGEAAVVCLRAPKKALTVGHVGRTLTLGQTVKALFYPCLAELVLGPNVRSAFVSLFVGGAGFRSLRPSARCGRLDTRWRGEERFISQEHPCRGGAYIPSDPI
jgi:hypothetical protein